VPPRSARIPRPPRAPKLVVCGPRLGRLPLGQRSRATPPKPWGRRPPRALERLSERRSPRCAVHDQVRRARRIAGVAHRVLSGARPVFRSALSARRSRTGTCLRAGCSHVWRRRCEGCRYERGDRRSRRTLVPLGGDHQTPGGLQSHRHRAGGRRFGNHPSGARRGGRDLCPGRRRGPETRSLRFEPSARPVALGGPDRTAPDQTWTVAYRRFERTYRRSGRTYRLFGRTHRRSARTESVPRFGRRDHLPKCADAAFCRSSRCPLIGPTGSPRFLNGLTGNAQAVTVPLSSCHRATTAGIRRGGRRSTRTTHCWAGRLCCDEVDRFQP
jgi:hypothetical protein